jgi:hypothetical protein
MTDRVVAYTPTGLGTAATIATAFESHSVWLTAGAAVLGGTLETADKWWQRYKVRREKKRK